MKKLFLSLVLAGSLAVANAQTEVSLSDFNSKAESLSGQSVKVSGYLVEIGKDGKTAMISTSAKMEKPTQGQKPSGNIVRVTSSSAINTSLKGASVTVVGTVAEEKMQDFKGGKGGNNNAKDTTARPQRPPQGGKGNVSDTTKRPTSPQNNKNGKGGKHTQYIIENVTISKN